MKVKLSKMNGIVPATDSILLPETYAQTAQNVDLASGILKAIKIPGQVAVLPDAVRKTIFPYNSGWLSWTTEVNVCRSAIDSDQFDRILYTGSGVPKVRGIVSAVEQEYALGLPKPVGLITGSAQAKGSVTWTRTWYYQYEEADGSVSQSGSLAEGAYGGANVHEVTPGSQYRIETVPAKTTASASAVFVMYFDAYSAGGSYLGRLYPAISAYGNNKDFYLSGAQSTGSQTNSGSSPQAVLNLTYDTSRASDYAVDRAYRYSFVHGWGTTATEEGPLSEPSAIISVDPTEDGNLAGLDTGITAYNAASTYKLGQAVTQAGRYYVSNQNIDTAEAFTAAHWDDYGTSNPWNIIKKRIYRTVTGDQGTYYALVAEIAIATGTYLDTVLDEDLGAEQVSDGWLIPPAGLKGLVEYPGGILAGYKDRSIYFCVPYQPHAWKRSYVQTVHFDIAGLGVNSSGLVVTTTNGIPYLITGYHPSAMSQLKIDSTQSCSNSRSIAVYGDRASAVVLYASPDGLTAIDGGIARVISESIWTKDQWQALSPTTMIGVVNEGRYFGFSSAGTIIFPLTASAGKEPVTTDETCAGAHNDLETDLLYMIQGANIKSWGTGATNKTITWKSKKFKAERRLSFNVVRVRAESYTGDTVICKVYGNETLYATVTLRAATARHLPIMRDEVYWEFQVESNHDIYEIVLSSSMRDL
jgi:hypothetical protein